MSEEIPESVRHLAPNPADVLLKRIGYKCIVRATPDVEGSWIAIGGVAEKGGIYVDSTQARVYYRMPKKGNSECRVVLPDDAPFRANQKGLIKGRSKSFDAAGNPVPGLMLLYAVKTKQLDDRVMAIKALPTATWGVCARAEIISKMKSLTESADEFLMFVSEMIAKSLSQEAGLANWNLWEKIADDAAKFTQRRVDMTKGVSATDNYGLFIQAVKETTIMFDGLAAQNTVRKRWEDLGGRGEWREIRKTLGFRWMPTELQWKKSWPAYLVAAKLKLNLKYPEVTDVPFGKSDKTIPGIWPVD